MTQRAPFGGISTLALSLLLGGDGAAKALAEAGAEALAQTSSSARSDAPDQLPDHARLMFDGQEALAEGRHGEAEALLRRAFDGFRGRDARATGVAQRWWALSIMEQQPFPAERADTFMELADEDGALASADLWNPALRLILRQTATAAPAERGEVWRRGLDRLRPYADDMPLRPEALADLDRLLSVGDGTQEFAPLDVLDGLLLATPSADAMRELARRRHDDLAAAGRADEARYAAWLRAALALATDEDTVASTVAYEGKQGAAGAAVPTLPPAPSRPTPEGGLAEQAQQALATADPRQARRRGWLASFAGDDAAAVEAARQAIETAPPGQIGRRLDDGAAIVALASGRLDGTGPLTRWYAARLGVIETSSLDGELSAWLDSAGELEVTQGSFGSLPPSAQAEMIRRDLQQRSGACLRWAGEAVAGGADELGVWFWTSALEHEPSALDDLTRQVRAMEDRGRALELIQAIGRGAETAALGSRLAFLEATLRYEAGQMEESLGLLARAEDAPDGTLDDAERASIGLMRAVALVKLRRLEEAAGALADVERLNGEAEQLAQALFLEGWIHLNRNETQEALARFRRLADVYPGTSYALKVRELIRRLEVAELTN